MKYLLAIMCVCVMGCAKTQPTKVATTVSECDALYQHNLVLALTSSEDAEYYQQHSDLAVEQLDQWMTQSGKKDRFYLRCVDKMTPEQVECAMRADSFQAENLCATP